MLDPHDPWIYELAFPGSISGEAEVHCPHCGTLLTVPVNDPTGTENYACANCRTQFVVNWGE
jgi:DNA-directed RNA polymerase subunit RPC12/RpoP